MFLVYGNRTSSNLFNPFPLQVQSNCIILLFLCTKRLYVKHGLKLSHFCLLIRKNIFLFLISRDLFVWTVVYCFNIYLFIPNIHWLHLNLTWHRGDTIKHYKTCGNMGICAVPAITGFLYVNVMLPCACKNYIVIPISKFEKKRSYDLFTLYRKAMNGLSMNPKLDVQSRSVFFQRLPCA